MCLYYTSKIASKFQVPSIAFHGFSCFCLLSLHNVHSSKILDSITSDSEYFTIPGLPDKFEFTKVQFPVNGRGNENWKGIFEPIAEAERASHGAVINTFEELESCYVKEYKKVRKDKAWFIGPVSLSHQDEQDKAQRGNKASVNEYQCLKWLDSQELCNLCLPWKHQQCEASTIDRVGFGLRGIKQAIHLGLKRK
ncbi:hypothetical protein DITRI_Ditri06bG0055300 [Diplodiscus trichospermus]